MKFNSLFLLLIFIFSFQNSFGKQDSLRNNKKRFFWVGAGISASLLGSYYYIENSWWSEKKVAFHFDDGADLTYALNVDKMGHFMGGLQFADFFASSMQWAGMKRKESIWYGSIFGSGVQLAIEMKDAYAPYWGFSKWDLAFGSAGAFWPVLQYYNKNLKAINFKFSYYKRSEIYWDLESQRGKEVSRYLWQDDYPNQTYWMVIDLNELIETCCWPDWLNIAIGFGLDDSQYLDENFSKKGGNNEWYIALDYDIDKIFKSWNSPTAKTIKHWLNYIHFPAPTIRITPKLEFFPVFL